MSYPLRAAFKVGGTIVLTVALCLAMVMGLAACGVEDDSSATTAEVTATVEGGTATTAAAATIDEALIGKWTITAEEAETDFGGTLEFTPEGKMIATSDDPAEETLEFTYSAQGGNLSVRMGGVEQPASTYTIKGDVLTITDVDTGDSESYTRVVQ